MSALTLEMRWNDPDDVDRLFAEHGDQIAGVLIEPVVTACGLVPPEPGYLEHIRDLTRSHGALLAFDEVKTGLTVGPGGATGLYGIEPDLVCLAKSLGGGLPAGATGGTEEVMDQIVSGSYLQLGTFNGNPLSMAATRAVLQVLDDERLSSTSTDWRRGSTTGSARRSRTGTCRRRLSSSGRGDRSPSGANPSSSTATSSRLTSGTTAPPGSTCTTGGCSSSLGAAGCNGCCRSSTAMPTLIGSSTAFAGFAAALRGPSLTRDAVPPILRWRRGGGRRRCVPGIPSWSRRHSER